MPFQVIVNTEQQYPVITLINTTHFCEAEIYAFGGILNKFKINVHEKPVNVVDGFTSVQDAVENMPPAFKGALLSPFTCRMNLGKYQLQGQQYTIEKFYLKQHAIHGVIFDKVYTITNTEETKTSASVTLQYQYTGTDAGYPFAYTISHVWTLTENNTVSVATSVVNQSEQTIPYAQGWHPYFTLGEKVNDCTLQFNSTTMVDFDETLLPTGQLSADARFLDATLIGDTFLDNCFQLKDTNKPACTLSNNQVQLAILPDASYPYLQIYTPPHRNSIAIENLSGAPDCFNNGMGLLQIAPQSVTNFTTAYQLTAL